MKYLKLYFFSLLCLLLATRLKGAERYGLYYYAFDDDPLIESCAKEKPIIFKLMIDFLEMVIAESNYSISECVRNKIGPGFTSPPGIARNIFAVMSIAYNTYARYHQNAKPMLMYDGWTRMSQPQKQVPDCVYVYGFYQIARFLMPERTDNYSFKQKYENDSKCDLTSVSADTNSDFGWIQRDVDQLKISLKSDGFNQDGCFADTTNFRTINPPCRLDNKSTVQECRDFTDKYDTKWNYGEMVKTGYVDKPRTTALSQAQQGRPFSLERLYDYLAPPYFEAPAFENGTMVNLTTQFLDLTEIQKTLDVDNDKPKLIAEFWAGGPKTTGTPGYWQSITLNIIRRYCYDNDQALKLLFAVSAAIYDAGLAAWQNKRLYNSVRPAIYIPTQHINERFQNQFIGMYCPFGDIEGWEWSPYQENNVITPEFQEYISGHSTFSRAAAHVLEMFTGSPNVPGNLTVTIKAGQSLFQPRCNQSEKCYIPCRVNGAFDSNNNYIPKVDVTLGGWKTYRDIADEASISRKYGGIHISSGDIQGRITGQKVGEKVWEKLSDLFNNGVTSTSNQLHFKIVFSFIPFLVNYYSKKY